MGGAGLQFELFGATFDLSIIYGYHTQTWSARTVCKVMQTVRYRITMDYLLPFI